MPKSQQLEEQHYPSSETPIVVPADQTPRYSHFAWVKNPHIMVPLIILFLLYIGLNVWIYRYGSGGFGSNLDLMTTQLSIVKEQGMPFRTTPTPTPIQLHPDNGTQGTYTGSQASHAGPAVPKVIFDPLDVRKGQTLTILATLKSNSPVTIASGDVLTDHGHSSFTMGRISGNDLEGVWKGSFFLNDTVWYVYTLTITAADASGMNTIVVSPR